MPCRSNKYLYFQGNNVKYREYDEKYMDRKEAIHELLWNTDRGVWQDYYIPTNTHRDYFFPSNVFPMYAECFGNSDAEKDEMEEKVRKYLQVPKPFINTTLPTSNIIFLKTLICFRSNL